MEKITFFDIEYANSKNKSICQIGIECINYTTKEAYFPELNIYVNPEDGFDENCVRVHGITASKVSSEDNFRTVWGSIAKYFTNSVVVGHNVASSDLDALVKNLKRYDIDVPEIYYICTYELAKEFVPDYAVKNYSLAALCQFFEIDIESEHDAFDDACACEDLLYALVKAYSINLDKYVKKYVQHETNDFVQFISSSMLRKSISDFYGTIRGFSIDNIINTEETEYIIEWKDKHKEYISHTEIKDIINFIDNILTDGIITVDEITNLQRIVKKYLDTVSTSPITLSTQILNGIMKGITIDGTVSQSECKQLQLWLYDNIYLSGHYPFDRITTAIEKILEDGIVTSNESAELTSMINELLHPVDTLKKQLHTVSGKHICLSGNFAFGPKSAVERHLTNKGAIIDNNVKTSTDILIIGDCECQSYSNGNYGTKVIKAIEFNERGRNIQLVKESEIL